MQQAAQGAAVALLVVVRCVGVIHVPDKAAMIEIVMSPKSFDRTGNRSSGRIPYTPKLVCSGTGRDHRAGCNNRLEAVMDPS